MTAITYEDLKFPVYLNSREIGSVAGVPLTVCDAINAAQLAKLNVFLAGKKGCGKTQLLRDMCNNRFGGNGVNLEGRVDMKIDEVYKQVNLKKIFDKTAHNEKELVELAKTAGHHFIGVDELNRCPEVVQNELLSAMNGYIMYDGKPYQLGNGFAVGLATGNLGNGGYVGTFKIDDALADRLHLFINLDYWKPTVEDKVEIDKRTEIDPRVIESQHRDISNRIIAAHKEIMAKPTRLETTVFGRFFEQALDYCRTHNSAGNSKDNLMERWPSICTEKSCPLRNSYCARIKSVGERTVKAMKLLAQGLQYVAALKSPGCKDAPIEAILTAANLMLPYSGSISHVYLNEADVFGNPNIAAKSLVNEIQNQISEQLGTAEKPGPFVTSFAFAKSGRLNEFPYSPSDASWGFARHYLEMIAKEAKK
jgi:hypothetical protein